MKVRGGVKLFAVMLFVALCAPLALAQAAAGDIDGLWLGTLDTGAIKLRMVFKFASTAEGTTGQLQSPDQSDAWIPVTAVQRESDTVRITIGRIQATYEGKLAADRQSMAGTFTQRGTPFAVALQREKNAASLERKRPQNPVKPYPYREEQVSYANAAAGITLAATLTVPEGKGPFPAVLLIAGSGPHDRDEMLLGHRPFLVLADFLARHGIVVLRADKRGVAKSTGNYATATTEDFAADVDAGVAFLKTRAEVDAHRIGLIGHSEGAVVAPMVAVKDADVAFVVMMAGTGVTGEDILVEQSRLISLASGMSAETVAKNAEEERSLLELVRKTSDAAALEDRLRQRLLMNGVPAVQIEAQVSALSSPWMRYFLSYDPATALRKLTKPVLVLNGSLDLQVPPAQNLPPIRKALAEAGNKHAEIDELPGLNHLFQTAKTGAPAEYGEIEETISPVVLEKIGSWVRKQ